MAVNLSPIWGAGAQLFDNSGNVLSGGKIYTYAAGTTTPAITYTSSTGGTANSNPIILNSAGRAPYEIWLTDGISYKFVLKDSSDALIGTWDNIKGVSNLVLPIDSSDVTYTPPFAGSTATTVENKFAQIIGVKDFGATGDGVTDDTAAIQNAEDYATSLGYAVELFFPSGTYAITDSILKKTNVYWTGTGKIKRKDNAAPTGTQWALVFANQINNWSINGLSFEAISQDIISSTSLPRGNSGTAAPGGWNSCVDAYKCQYWTIENCYFEKFSQGIKYLGSGNFTITTNEFYSNTGYTVDDVLAGTPQTFTFNSSGAIMYLYDTTYATAPVRPLGQYIISNNRIIVPGLDLGIEVLENNYGKAPCVVSSNVVSGPHSGIQAYNGSLPDPGGAYTYQSASIIANNHIYATWEQGIYLRGVSGVQVIGNYIERAAQTNSNPDASAGAIVLRINPWDIASAVTFKSAADGDVSDDHAFIIAYNRCVDTGRDGVAVPTAVIYIRISNAKVFGNDIMQSTEHFSTASIPAVLVANGGRIKNFELTDNKISGPFTYGILVTDVVRTTSLSTHWGKIQNNELELINATSGIDCSWFAFNIAIENNRIVGTTTGTRIRNAPYSSIIGNKYYNCTTAVTIAGGCLASDVPYLQSGGTVTRAIRRGGTINVYENEYWNCTNTYSVAETNADDALFSGRTAQWHSERINGAMTYPLSYSGATATTGSNARTWNVNDRTYNSTPAVGATPGKVCLTAGTYGSATTTTGDVTTGSAVITNVASLDGFGPGVYITCTGFSAPVNVVSVDTTANTITVSTTSSSTSAGVTISPATPTFGSMANLA